MHGGKLVVEAASPQAVAMLRYGTTGLAHRLNAQLGDDVISEVGATSIRDMGRVMAGVMHQVSGRADGSSVSQLVKEKLA